MGDESYDVIVVGAGSAGCVVAARLAATTDARILLLEAGGADGHPSIAAGDLAATLSLWTPGSDLDWGYHTPPQPGLNDRPVPVLRGKVWGGSGSLNAMLQVRGNAADYDAWGVPGWAYRDVLPYFRMAETYEGDPHYRGSDGPIPVRRLTRPTPVADRLFAAGPAVGLRDEGPSFDYNAARQDGTVFRYQATRDADGRRASTATAYLHPALGRPNLVVRSHAQATRILLDRTGSRAVGVEYLEDGQLGDGRLRRAGAAAEVILCAGAYGSPHLLMVSGIGSTDALTSCGIPVRHHLPGVGQGLRDHLLVPVAYQSRRDHPHPPELVAETGAFTHSPDADPASPPDLQLKLAGLLFTGPEYHYDGPAFTFAVVLVRPASTGTVTPRSADPTALATVDHRYLGDGRDVAALAHGVELVRELAATKAFAEFRGGEIAPGSQISGRSAVRDYVRAAATTLWHPTGGCAMGTGVDAAVGPDLVVRGVSGLRVADASVLPGAISGNTNAACVMIGERAAELVRRAHTSGRVEVSDARA